MSRHAVSRRSHGHPRLAVLAVALLATAVAPSLAGEVRVIRAPGIAPPPTADRPPERVEIAPRPVAPKKIAPRRFPLVAVEDAATLTAGEFRLVLPGVAPLALEERCRDAAGVEWPCGGRMLAAERLALRRKPIVCDVPDGVKKGRFETTCRLEQIAAGSPPTAVDLADLIVRRGWARATPGGPLAEAEDEARRERSGLHGAAPPIETLPASLTATDHTVPPDLTTAPIGAPLPAQTQTAPTQSAPMPLSR